MKLYGAPLSPYVRKVLVYAAHKGIDLELIPVGVGDPDPDFVACSPFRKMPGFRDGDFTISDSTAIVTYLEAKHPEPVLIPADPVERARTIWFEEFADTIFVAAGGKIFFNRVVSPRFMGKPGDEAVALQGEAELIPVLDYLEGVIPPSNHLVGDRLTLADIAVASPFVNLELAGTHFDRAKYPKIAAFVDAMLAGPGFAEWLPREKKMLGMA